MAHIQLQKTPSITPTDEQILVVPRAILFKNECWQGIKKDNLTAILDLIKTHKEFHPRQEMEVNPIYKQIIPYVIFKHNDKLFVMQRQANASEKRLQSKYSLGIGGHMREHDMKGVTLFDWAQREFHEEVTYTDPFTMTPLGILNDDSNEVGKVHLGLVLLIEGKTDRISIKSELKSGILMTVQECHAVYPHMESWSKMVLDSLISE